MEYAENRSLPVLPIRNSIIFPGTTLPFKIGRPKSIRAVQSARESGNWIIIVAQKEDYADREPTPADLYRVGTLCKIEKVKGTPQEGYHILARGISKIEMTEFIEGKEAIYARGIERKDQTDIDSRTLEALLTAIKKLAVESLELLPTDTSQMVELIQSIEDPSLLIHVCTGNLEVPTPVKQEILENSSIKSKALTLLELLQKQKDGLLVQMQIQDKLSHKLGKSQRESILREQLKTIREELGENSESSDKNDYRNRIEEAGMPEDAKTIAQDELKRLEVIGNASPEAHVIRNYLDLMCSLPWSKASVRTADDIQLDQALESLNSDHYGLEKIKERILQHLAVMKLKKSTKGSILVFVGPPGVGKTSLGQSIAKVMGRKFVRVSLGGVRDDAEIRGHRRTYIGAMPGRILQGIKRAGENNPVFLLDEIDKLARSFQGDPAAALLEVLDPEQNATFMDHYLDTPFDLSNVFFIATANSLESIPGPLLDRMEVIELSGYTTAEKLHIAKNHLVPKQLNEFGIEPSQLIFEDEALTRIITHHTREAGVRDLQRKIATVCRASSRSVLAKTDGQVPVTITLHALEDLLGPEKVHHEIAEKVTSPGVVTGLAWTPQGGEILFVEASLMPGSGRLILTGQLGDVMKESAQIALSLVKARLGLDAEKKDIHIHVPMGSIPKDGPSAGIALLSTIASLFSGYGVSPKLAMTGEITLRGAVMPVGGIKEKVLAAHRAGIEKVILSQRNKKDLQEVPEEVRSQMKFEFVENAAEVIKIALGLNFDSSAQAHSPLASPAVA